MVPELLRNVFVLQSKDWVLFKRRINIFSLGMPSLSTMYLYLSNNTVVFPEPAAPFRISFELSAASIMLFNSLSEIIANHPKISLGIIIAPYSKFKNTFIKIYIRHNIYTATTCIIKINGIPNINLRCFVLCPNSKKDI